jgi:serine/threonine protein phosphatase PrpC
MGNLLGAPVTDKETHVGSTAELKYGLSSMQGWRVHMEDAHIAETSLYYFNAENQKVYLGNHSLFAVFDGHGGTYAAKYSGKNFCRVLTKQPKWKEYGELLTKSPPQEEKQKVEWARQLLEALEHALKIAFVDLDQEIGFAMQRNPHADANQPYNETDQSTTNNDGDDDDAEMKGTDDADLMMKAATDHVKALNKQDTPDEDDAGDDSGTTACIVLVTPEHLVCANAGDSRSVYSKTSQKAIPLSYDHKPDDEEEERRIRAAGGYVAGGRVEGDLAVSRGLGDFRFKHLPTVLAAGTGTGNMQPHEQKVSPVPDIIVQSRNKDQDEFIIVACDGIWDVRSNQDCVDEVASLFEEGETDLGLLSEEILDRCLQLGSKDNMTALVVQFPSQKVGYGGGVTARREEREKLLKEQQQQPGSDDGSSSAYL